MTRSLCAVLLACAVAGQACSAKDDPDPPLARPEFVPGAGRAPLGSPLDVTYRFRVADAARFDRDYRVMVHFVDLDGELMWTDDHEPPVPSSEWRPGATIEYSRTVFIPIYPYIGEAAVHMGLYSPEDQSRVPLEGQHRGQRAYRVGTLEIRPQSENVFLIYTDGWHPAESAPDNPAVEWRWTGQEAIITFRNPKQDAIFYLLADGRPDLFDAPQRVSVLLGGESLDAFPAEAVDPVLRKIPLPAARMGTDEMVELALAVDRTFVPALVPAARAIHDSRELGIRVFHAFVQPQ